MATSAEPSAQQLATLIHLATLTHLEGQIRVAKTIPELQFLSVNETRRLVPYEQAYLLSGDVPGGAAPARWSVPPAWPSWSGTRP